MPTFSFQQLRSTGDLLHLTRDALYIVPLDEAWLYFSNHFDRIWLPYDELPSSFPKQTIANQKSTITVVWNPHGLHVIQSLPKGIKWTGKYDSDNIVSQIDALRDLGSHGKMIVHADNAGPHVAKCVTEYMDHNPLKRAPHSPDSPDLAPSEFYLFGYVKHQLQGHECMEGAELALAIS
jgi:hypothetical protein